MTLFEHLDGITIKKTKWESLDKDSQKVYNNYMINKFVSMKQDYLEIVNIIEKYNIPSEFNYKFYLGLLPKTKTYFKFIKSNSVSYDKELIGYLVQYFECSIKEVKDRLKILEKEEIQDILGSIGLEDKLIKKLIKTL